MDKLFTSSHEEVPPPAAAAAAQSFVQSGEISKKIVKYTGCMKNHAAAMGVIATDGCGEYMPPVGDDGSSEALICSACDCHRNFHRKLEFEVDVNLNNTNDNNTNINYCHYNSHNNYVGGSLVISEATADDKGRKRVRTKFSAEQKEKMLEFAESVGWKMQKQEEGLVHDFCEGIGIKRRTFKVWMHNNKNKMKIN